jgi:secreted Zn-dependent insulinase-like peptidase
MAHGSLVFLGSKEYPYKGVLDQLANRAGSNGTNAWTANDRMSNFLWIYRDARADNQILRTLSRQLERRAS